MPMSSIGSIYQELLDKKTRLAVIGLGYVGLPIALEFAKKVRVIGFDIDETRVSLMSQGIDPSRELDPQAFEDSDIMFTSDPAQLQDASFFIVSVPTPVDEQHVPDLSALKLASRTLSKVISKNDYVVFESTVYPGCTEDDCLPIIEAGSGLQRMWDFKAGYSPERITSGDKTHTLSDVVKVVSGCDQESLETIGAVYELVVKAGVYRAPSIRIAEAAKVIENSQRDLNIALMNELSLIFDLMDINTFEVLEAAGTKWNFLPFRPGLVGGHCIGVDPYYLTYKANQLGYQSQVILAGRAINDSMGRHVVQRVIKHLIRMVGDVKRARVLVKGATFKENVSDIRNSKVADVVKGLQEFYVNVDVEDPYASSSELREKYGFGLSYDGGKMYDAVIISVAHHAYLELDDAWFAGITNEGALIADLKGIYRGRITNRDYWSL